MTTASTPPAGVSLRDVPAIIDRLEKSRFNFLDIQWGDLRITLGDQAAMPARDIAAPAPLATPMAAPLAAPRVAVPTTAPASAPVPAAAPAVATAAPVGEGTPVKAPMVGRFYARPEPGAEPFVKVGDRITADTTIGLIEVMKVFNAVTAGMAGVVTALAVQDGDFVEFDQPLAYLKA
jgi:acetyl-CoA carboxylase biotin carboxyl carrier protein